MEKSFLLLCLGSGEQCCLGLDTLVGKAGGGIIFGIDNYAYDTSTEHIKHWHISTNIVYLTQYLQMKVFSFLTVAKVVFSFVHLSKRN